MKWVLCLCVCTVVINRGSGGGQPKSGSKLNSNGSGGSRCSPNSWLVTILIITNKEEFGYFRSDQLYKFKWASAFFAPECPFDWGVSNRYFGNGQVLGSCCEKGFFPKQGDADYHLFWLILVLIFSSHRYYFHFHFLFPHGGEKSNKCSLCDYAYSRADHFR